MKRELDPVLREVLFSLKPGAATYWSGEAGWVRYMYPADYWEWELWGVAGSSDMFELVLAALDKGPGDRADD
ncbi:hypothetical protein BLA60_25795 [Actinophytocola xinjiangensis]|uniref:Uncharacterized protein n=1 Tax=Actinophytocola xinjiangensis TaxID=485602 RepID=A0A7Z0WLK7_9PSEU|nr:hypothetical protein BLA60_25795 [Actinophytocola xinjiangensis]